jgi:cytochrome b561
VSLPLKNDPARYGLVSIALHWLMALLIVGLYFLGDYMVDLDYYHPWYLKAPDLHRSLGLLVAALLVLRLVWRRLNPRPRAEGHPWERHIAAWMHGMLYVMTGVAAVSGYLISTGDGQGVQVFGLFEVPALNDGFDNQEDYAGLVHEFSTDALLLLALLHGLAALKHHFFDRDRTLRRMLWPSRTPSVSPTED